jgi:hypothetical protein
VISPQATDDLRALAKVGKVLLWIFVAPVLTFLLISSALNGLSARANERAAQAAPPISAIWLTYDFRVPRNRLSTQEDKPFLFFGTVMDQEHPRWEQFRAAIQGYPDILSCLRPEERAAERPNLLAYDWFRVRGDNVCLFRIASTLGSIERVRAWMAASGMKLRLPRAWSVSSHSGTYVEGTWTLDEANRRASLLAPSGRAILGLFQWLERKDRLKSNYFVTFRVDFDANGQVYGVDISFTSPLN